MDRFRNRELQPLRSRKRYLAWATFRNGQVVPLTTMVLKKASGFQMGEISDGRPAGSPMKGIFRLFGSMPSKKARLSG